MTEKTIQTLLQASLTLEKVLEHAGLSHHASLVRQMTSQRVLSMLSLQEKQPVTCLICRHMIKTAQEQAFYNHTSLCYACDSGYSDYLDAYKEQDGTKL